MLVPCWVVCRKFINFSLLLFVADNYGSKSIITKVWFFFWWIISVLISSNQAKLLSLDFLCSCVVPCNQTCLASVSFQNFGRHVFMKCLWQENMSCTVKGTPFKPFMFYFINLSWTVTLVTRIVLLTSSKNFALSIAHTATWKSWFKIKNKNHSASFLVEWWIVFDSTGAWATYSILPGAKNRMDHRLLVFSYFVIITQYHKLRYQLRNVLTGTLQIFSTELDGVNATTY